ncbi:MAG TPA: phenylalanine--tRNA ligase subunit alpha [Rhodothermales bacterium]|nr:phenylalanine--tRNA ligase subunit alpha [Rhodothermales bacterium]
MIDAQIDAVAAEIEAADLATPEAAEAFRVRFLGRKAGAVTDLFGRMGEAAPDARRALGARLNTLKQRAQERLDEAQAVQTTAPVSAGPALDLTLPGRIPAPVEAGSLHPLAQTLAEIERVFHGFGFAVATGPEIEDDWHNFEALAFPPDHPARDMQDTFWIEPPPPEGRGVLLRTHTSPVQVRVMQHAARTASGPPGSLDAPIRVIVPGRVYRNEAISYKSFCLFHQVEGLVVGEGVSFADLKGMLRTFARAFFGDDVRMRFRPSFFPFTEPSAEVDIWWAIEGHPEGGRWMEVLGCGMVDPDVFAQVGIDPERYTGYAFGMGGERLAMLRHDIQDIRLFYENDVRFLRQF